MNSLLGEKGIRVKRFMIYKNIENYSINEFMEEYDGYIIDIKTVSSAEMAYIIVIYKEKDV